MTSLKQIEANRLNALKSTGPRTEEGKLRSRQNALRHGLTARTVVAALEDADEYQSFAAGIAADYGARTASERELISRLASVLWRLRRSTAIETGLFQIQGELMDRRGYGGGRRRLPLPQWLDELDRAALAVSPEGLDDAAQDLAHCFLQVSQLGYGAFDLLSRYEAALWRQAAQILLLLRSARP